jgi:hypothetical protein
MLPLGASQANAASSSRVRATTAAMARHITSLGYPYTTATCQGLGKRKHHTYAAFRCVAKGTVIYYEPMGLSLTLWAKPLRGGWCGSAFSLKTCHRLTMPVYGSEDYWAAAVNAHVYGGPQPPNKEDIVCQPSGTNTYACSAGYTVAWTKASYGWLPTVTP